jgi:large subunit ribosomal protein L21e
MERGMARRLGGNRRKSANKFEKSHRQRGKISMSRLFQVFEVDDRVMLVAEPAYHKGLFHSRFHGKSGKIIGTQGGCYRVCVRDGGKDKTIVTPGIHLKLQKK